MSVLLAMSATVSPRLTGLPPSGDDVFFHLVESSVVESASSLVFGEHGRVAVAEAEAGVAFPVVAESVNLVEFDTAVGVDEVGEHAAPTDGGELAGVANKDDPPVAAVGKPSELCQLGGGSGSGFVDDHGGPCR